MEKKEPKKKERKKLGVGKFFRELQGEVKKLTWPTRKELISYTLTVMGFIVMMSIIIYVLDLAFAEGVGLLSKI